MSGSDGTGAIIRPVRLDDATAIAGIYAPYVRETVITFETEPPDAAEMRARIERLTATHPWLVAERNGAIIGYAYGYPYRARAAYQWVAEAGIYMAQEARGSGLGTPLYAALLESLARAGYVSAIGALTVGNAASVKLHERLGFRLVGTQTGIGFKHGEWRDVEFWQKDLAERLAEPVAPSV